MVAGKIGVANVMIIMWRNNTDANYEEKADYYSSNR